MHVGTKNMIYQSQITKMAYGIVLNKFKLTMSKYPTGLWDPVKITWIRSRHAQMAHGTSAENINHVQQNTKIA